MKLMPCPLNGPRPIGEFVCRGTVCERPDPNADAAIWAAYVFEDENAAGLVAEWWLHVPSGFWFVAIRDTTSDKIVETMTYAEFATRATKVRSG